MSIIFCFQMCNSTVVKYRPNYSFLLIFDKKMVDICTHKEYLYPINQVDFIRRNNILELERSIADLLVLVRKVAPSSVFIHSQVERLLENQESYVIQTRT